MLSQIIKCKVFWSLITWKNFVKWILSIIHQIVKKSQMRTARLHNFHESLFSTKNSVKSYFVEMSVHGQWFDEIFFKWDWIFLFSRTQCKKISVPWKNSSNQYFIVNFLISRNFCDKIGGLWAFDCS